MSNYYVGLRHIEGKTIKKRAASRLKALRADLREKCIRKSPTSLLLATWNIRDFDSNKFGFGPRLEESFYYIAEIISSFDLVAVQEVNRDLSALQKVMKILGREWDYIVTDTTEGAGGNAERMAFLFNTEKVWFRKIAGEVVLPDGQLIVAPAKKSKKPDEAGAEPPTNKLQFARTPFLVAFQSNWFQFSLCTVHIYYGAASGAALERRIDEIKRLAKFFAQRQDVETKQERSRTGQVENYILLGDFNIVSPKHKTMEALTAEKFVVPEEIADRSALLSADHFYDQIAVRVKDKRFKIVGGGVYDMYGQLFRDDDLDIYRKHMPETDPEPTGKAKTQEALFKKWRTWQMSDHHPLWIEIETDYADDYLDGIAAGED
jgi:endonuclease/exonuclease/phosphatase family metal-dependent hydrolase